MRAQHYNMKAALTLGKKLASSASETEDNEEEYAKAIAPESMDLTTSEAVDGQSNSSLPNISDSPKSLLKNSEGSEHCSSGSSLSSFDKRVRIVDSRSRKKERIAQEGVEGTTPDAKKHAGRSSSGHSSEGDDEYESE
jgi:hypothetical protein